MSALASWAALDASPPDYQAMADRRFNRTDKLRANGLHATADLNDRRGNLFKSVTRRLEWAPRARAREVAA